MTTRAKLVKEDLDYFSDLFHERPTNSDPKWFPRLVFPKMNVLLSWMTLEKEIKRIIFSLFLGKVPGPDEFTRGFFQRYWG